MFCRGLFSRSRKSLIYTIFCDTYLITDIFKAPPGRNKKQKTEANVPYSGGPFLAVQSCRIAIFRAVIGCDF